MISLLNSRVNSTLLLAAGRCLAELGKGIEPFDINVGQAVSIVYGLDFPQRGFALLRLPVLGSVWASRFLQAQFFDCQKAVMFAAAHARTSFRGSVPRSLGLEISRPERPGAALLGAHLVDAAI